MPKRTLFTNITPLPAQIPRELAIAMLHNHDEMIELNPLVIEHHPIKAPRDAPADEFLDCVWQEMTDRVSYLPGGLVKGKVTYKACFHDYPSGLQTHIYAPLGVDIREKWSIGGNAPGEPPEARELGVDKPSSGLYLREDGDLRCSRMTHAFVLKNLDVAHKVLVERIIKKAERIDDFFMNNQAPLASPSLGKSNAVGSHMSTSAFIQAAQSQGGPAQRPDSYISTMSSGLQSPQMLSPQQDGDALRGVHPAFRNDESRQSGYPPSYLSQNQNRRLSYQGDSKQQQSPQEQSAAQLPPTSKQFVAELPGSTYHTNQSLAPNPNNSHFNRQSTASELGGEDVQRGPNSPNTTSNSDRGSAVSEGPGPGGYRYNPQDFAQRGHDRTSGVSELATPPMQQGHFQTQQMR